MKLVLVVVTAALLVPQLAAQSAEPDPAVGLSVKVSVWGQVNRPGRYFLTGTPDLLELLSAAGGPTAGADLDRILLIREQDGSRRRLNVNRIAAAGRPFLLTTNDVIIVPGTFWSRFREGMPAVTAAAAVANVVITLILLARR